jgi:hypothetical protein
VQLRIDDSTAYTKLHWSLRCFLRADVALLAQQLHTCFADACVAFSEQVELRSADVHDTRERIIIAYILHSSVMIAARVCESVLRSLLLVA